jgi:drug/metabolite transporter (DMT)-like permease
MANSYNLTARVAPAANTSPLLSERLAVPLALVSLYFIWGSTYLAIRFMVETLPPFYAASARFLVAGLILMAFLKLRGAPWPTRRQWAGAAAIGGLLLAAGNGLVTYSEQSIASGLAAVLVGTVPLWAAVFAALWGHRPTRLEATGLVIGFGGVALLNAGTSLNAHPLGAAICMVGAVCWAFGSVWSRYLQLPPGLMSAATQLVCGGTILLVIGAATGEHLSHAPATRSVLAMVYLAVMGSMVAYVAYVYLLKTVRPALATSYTYVNPAVAVVLGLVLNGEPITPAGGVALAIILVAVGLVVMGRKRQEPER